MVPAILMVGFGTAQVTNGSGMIVVVGCSMPLQATGITAVLLVGIRILLHSNGFGMARAILSAGPGTAQRRSGRGTAVEVGCLTQPLGNGRLTTLPAGTGILSHSSGFGMVAAILTVGIGTMQQLHGSGMVLESLTGMLDPSTARQVETISSLGTV